MYMIAWNMICFVSMIIPTIIIIILLYKFKKERINRLLIPTSIVFGIITFFVISYYAIEYTWYDLNTKILFNIIYLELILLPLSILTMYVFSEQKENKNLKIASVVITVIMLILFIILNSFVIKIDPNNVNYSYSVSIESENGSAGYIYIPFVKSENYTSSIFNSIKLSNSNSVVIPIQAKYGNALNISISSDIIIQGKGKIDRFVDMDMYGWNKSTREEFIYVFIFTNQNDTFIIDFNWNIRNRLSDEYWQFSGVVNKNGWNKINGDVRRYVV